MQLRIALWGATGAVGAEVLRQLRRAPEIASVCAISRRPLPSALVEGEGAPVEAIVIDDLADVNALGDALAGVDAGCWCVGVSQAAVPEEAAYRRITLDLTLAAARALCAASPEASFHFVSGGGADPSGRSWMMWARVKGEAENALHGVGFPRLWIWRPGYIHVVAGRARPSLGERLAALLYPLLRVIPGATNTTVDIAHAMLEAMPGEGGLHGARAITRLARAYQSTRPELAPPKRRRRWLRRLGYVALAALAALAVLLVLAWTPMGRAPTGARLARVEASPQHKGGRFENPLPERTDITLSLMWRFLAGEPNTRPEAALPLWPDTAATLAQPPASGLRVTWLGHSSLLVEIDGIRVLTDPVFSERCSPLSFVGPERFHPVPVDVQALAPTLDAVVISHDHYDHLDMPTIRGLIGARALFLVPLGVGAHLEYWGVPAARIVEHDWWDATRVGPVELTATPARHFSGRSPWDRNRTLWAGWALSGPQHRVFFSGDTALFPGFEEIGRRLGPFDATMVEVGAYGSGWPDVHLGPEQAVQAHRQLRGRLMFPVHWGTFNLALHSWVEPMERLRVAATDAGVSFVTPRPGEPIEPATPPAPQPWWPTLPWQSAAETPILSTGL